MSEKSIWKTRHSLLDRISDTEDKKSWDQFITHYEQFIYNVLISYGMNVSEAEDLRQVIFIKLWNIMPANPYSKEKGKFRNWLTSVIKNEVIQYQRTQLRRKKILESNQDSVKTRLHDDERVDELDAIINAEWEAHLMLNAWTKVSARLKEPAKTIFEMALDGKSHKEISEACGVNEAIVRVNKQRVKDLIKSTIEKDKE